MNRARFIAAARLEFLAEVIYYIEAQPGLGQRFAATVEETATRALAFPLSGSPFRSNTRRVMVKGFPFSLVYRPELDGSSSSRSHTMPDVPIIGDLVPANLAADERGSDQQRNHKGHHPSSHALLPKEKGISSHPSPLGRGVGVRMDTKEDQ